jgi:hypothetical protein
MAIISLSGAFTAPKRRPKTYKARDAAYQVGGNRGYYIASLPRSYPMTSQQRKVANVASECGIRPGISKSDLMNKMKDCVGPKMRK